MNTEITRIVLVLSGALTGHTGILNGRSFKNGRCEIVDAADKLPGAEHYFRTCYQAFKDGSTELKQAQDRWAAHLKSKEVPNGQHQVPAGTVGNEDAAVPSSVRSDGQRPGSEAAAVGVGPAAVPAGGAESVADGNGPKSPQVPDGELVAKIQDAVAKLDPKVKDHWSEDGKPSVEAVSAILTFPATRADIDSALGTKPAAGGGKSKPNKVK